MERTKLLIIAVIGLLLLNALTIGFLVVRPGRPGPPRGEGPAAVIIGRLHFDAQQQQQYRQLVTAHQREIRTLSDRSIRLYRDYYDLLTSNPPDTARANAINQQIGQNQRALAAVNFAHFQQIRTLCHPDQQADFARLVNDLTHLFDRQQHPERSGKGGPLRDRPGADRPPDGPGRSRGRPPENLPPRP